MAIFQGVYTFIAILFYGVIAVMLTIPFMDWLFGIKIVVVGSSAIAGMYLFLLSTVLVNVGAFIGIGLLGLLLWFLFAQAADFVIERRRAKH